MPVALMRRLPKVATPPTAATVSVPVSVPAAGLVPMATVTFPVKPVAVLPYVSRAVTATAGVIVMLALVFEGWAVKNSAVAVAGVTVTVAVWVIAVPPIVAEIVFEPATVELNVAVRTPLALVVPEAGVSTLPVPVAASATEAPASRLPLASRAVTVMVTVFAPALATTVPAEADTVDWEAEAPPAFTVTAAVWVIVTPLIVAEIVLGPATAEL